MNHILKTFKDDRDVYFSLAERGILDFNNISKKLSCDKELLLEISKSKVINISNLDSQILADTLFIHKLLRYRGRNIHYTKYDLGSLFSVYKNWHTHNKKYMTSSISDYFKMGKYETVVRTILKLDLPIELSRNVCKFL
jgi:hypothetical protein